MRLIIIALLLTITTACGPQLSSWDVRSTDAAVVRDEIDRMIRRYPEVISIESLEVLTGSNIVTAALEITESVNPRELADALTDEIREIYATRLESDSDDAAVIWYLLHGDQFTKATANIYFTRRGDELNSSTRLTSFTVPRSEAGPIMGTPEGEE